MENNPPADIQRCPHCPKKLFFSSKCTSPLEFVVCPHLNPQNCYRYFLNIFRFSLYVLNGTLWFFFFCFVSPHPCDIFSAVRSSLLNQVLLEKDQSSWLFSSDLFLTPSLCYGCCCSHWSLSSSTRSLKSPLLTVARYWVTSLLTYLYNHSIILSYIDIHIIRWHAIIL